MRSIDFITNNLSLNNMTNSKIDPDMFAQNAVNSLGWAGVLRLIRDALPLEDPRKEEVGRILSIVEPENPMKKAIAECGFEPIIQGLINTYAPHVFFSNSPCPIEIREQLEELIQ